MEAAFVSFFHRIARISFYRFDFKDFSSLLLALKVEDLWMMLKVIGGLLLTFWVTVAFILGYFGSFKNI
jgi:hypothetical protein